jgi:hypothetical protein
MPFRFRKSLKILPGVRLNLTKRGVSSVSVGRRGATLNLSKRGTRATVGLPGTGVSYSTDLGGGERKRPMNTLVRLILLLFFGGLLVFVCFGLWKWWNAVS